MCQNQSKITYFIYTSKVLLAHNPMHLFTDCLLSHRNGRAELWDKTVWPQTQDISYLPLYRKFADPFAVIIPIESLHPQQEQHTGGPCMWRRWRGDWSLEMSFLSLSTSCLTHGGSPVGVSPPPPFFSNFLHLLLLERELPSKPPLHSHGGLLCKFKAGFFCILSPVCFSQISPGQK